MALYKLCEWEENGYHDSYGYLAYYDSETKTLDSVMHWATAFAGNLDTSAYLLPTPEIVEEARKVLEVHIFNRLVYQDNRQVSSPTDGELDLGTRVRTVKAVRNKGREVSECPKCGGSGRWVNPRNSEDKRQCFKCHGTGKVQGQSTGQTVTIPKGTAGKIVDTYKYNPRSAVSFTIQADDGSLFRCGSASLRLDREPETEQHWRERAYELSFHFQWKPALSKHGGWLSTDWTAKIGEELRKRAGL